MDLKSLLEAVKASPDNLPLLMMVAQAYMEEFELEEARTYFDRVLALDAQHSGARVEIAKLLDLDGRTSEAILRLDVLCAEFPDCAGAWMLRARLSLKEGEGALAREFYDRAVALDEGLADDAFLTLVIKSGGATPSRSGDKRIAVAADGSLVEQAWDEDGDDDSPFEGMDAVTARELELEFRTKADVTFADVGGMEEVKEDIRMKIIYPIQKPDLFKAYGKKAGGGVLLYGPPGCGKTLLSRATAGEIEANFFSIGLHQVLDMYIGESEGKLHKIFELARRHAPSVLFFDEIDALAADRRDMRQSAARGIINQFLAEMDGAQGDNDGVLILGATNAPWHLDGAFLRPGRFDRLVFVPPPDGEARAEIAKIHAKDKPLVDWKAEDIAKRTAGFSGADLRAVFDQATEATLQEAMKRGEVVPVTGKMLNKATKQVKPSTRKWFESAKNYALYANQSGFYDDVLNFMGIKKK
jgi:transitional endoplasmic reticulum ATPase